MKNAEKFGLVAGMALVLMGCGNATERCWDAESDIRDLDGSLTRLKDTHLFDSFEQRKSEFDQADSKFKKVEREDLGMRCKQDDGSEVYTSDQAANFGPRLESLRMVFYPPKDAEVTEIRITKATFEIHAVFMFFPYKRDTIDVTNNVSQQCIGKNNCTIDAHGLYDAHGELGIIMKTDITYTCVSNGQQVGTTLTVYDHDVATGDHLYLPCFVKGSDGNLHI